MSSPTTVIVAGRVLQVVFSLVSVRIMTTMLSTAEVGNYYLIFTMISFFALAFINPIGLYLNRKVHCWADEQTIYSRLFTYNGYLAAVCLVTLPIVYVLCSYIGIGSNIRTVELMLFVMIGLYAMNWNQLLVSLLNILNHQRGFVLFSVLTLAAGLTLSVLCIQWFAAPTAIVWFLGQTIANAVVAVLAFMFFRRVIKGKLDLADVRASMDRDSVRSVMHFILPVGITALLMWLQNQSYRIIVEQRAGLEFLGMIGLGLGIASNIAAAVESLVQQLYLPMFYREISSADQDGRAVAWNRMAQLALPVFVALAMFVSCLSPFLVDVLAHGKFAGAWVFMAFGAWIELCRMTTGLLSGVAHAEMQTRHLVKSYLVGGGCSVAGVWAATGFSQSRLLVPAALLLSGIVATGVMYADMCRLMPTKIGIRTIRRSFLQSLPFLLALPLAVPERNLAVSLAVLAVAGVYLLLSQYRLARPLLAPGKAYE